MSNAGWYPDPGGAPGMFRFWDGAHWSPVVSATPGAPGSGPGVQPLSPQPPSTRQPTGGGPLLSRTPSANPYAGASGFAGATGPTLSKGSQWRSGAWLLLVFAVVAALVFGGLQLARGFGFDPLNPPAPSNPTIDPCPPATLTPETPVVHPSDGRVHGGKLSYPMLGSPWSAPGTDDRVPFGRDVAVQSVPVEKDFATVNGTSVSWVASVLVAELVAGDGFFSPHDGADLIAKCAMRAFYSDATVQRNDVSSKAVTLDGKDGWVIETHLTFDIPGLKVKGETAIFEVVRISDTSSSVYYASIPDSVPELLTVARQVQGQLRVDP